MNFSIPVRVYWEDTDAGGIVYYANYLKFFERARTDWLRALGLEQRQLREQTGGMFVVGECRIRYHRPARLDDALTVTAELNGVGRASMDLAQQAWLGAPGTAGATLLCEATVRAGWVDASTLRPARIPAGVLDILQA